MPPAIGYNLALASTLGLLGAGLFGLAYTLVRAQLTPSQPPPSHGAGAAAEPKTAQPTPPFLRREGGRGVRSLAPLLALIAVVATAVMGNLELAVELAARQRYRRCRVLAPSSA